MNPSKRLASLTVATLFCAIFAGFLGKSARADEIAPELQTLELRNRTKAESKRLFGGLAPNDQRRLAGTYVAFDGSAVDPSAMVACDDDGDYVIVVTDAMLRLLSAIARAQSSDEDGGSHNVEGYASFLGRSQVPGNRLLPPPAGFFTAQNAGLTQEQRLREAISFVIARELTHLRAGDLVCGHPTATHESGDDVWTRAEERRALETASAVYPGSAVARDVEATSRVLDAGLTEQGGLAVLRFFAQLELERVTQASRFIPTYVVQHPSAALRIATVQSAAHDRSAE